MRQWEVLNAEKSSRSSSAPLSTSESRQVEQLTVPKWVCSIEGQEYPIDLDRIQEAMNGKSRGLFQTPENKQRYGIFDEWLPEPCRGNTLDHTSVDLDVQPTDRYSGRPMNMFRVFFTQAEQTGKKIFCGVWQHPDASQIIPGLVSKHYVPCSRSG
jgi:hypothetical protein